jgi:O-succinylbenzoic acid--CoA ligase
MSLSVLEAAADSPDRLAVVSSASGERLTFAELGERVRHSIASLRELGLDGGASLPRVALVGENSLETICFLLALVEMGEPFVLLHPRLTERERSAILEEVRPSVVLARERYSELLAAASRAPEPAPATEIPDERCLAVLYTSGTSGRAKGALLSRRAFLASAEASAQNLGWTDEDRWLLCLPLAHVGALSVVTRCLLARRTIVLEEGGIAHVENLACTMERERVTLASLVPTVLRRLLDLRPAWRPPACLRAVLLGGAGAPPSLLDEARERAVPVLTTYGLTEACSQVTTQRYGTPPSAEQGAGEPLPGFEVRIRGEEIQVRGPALMSGYFPVGVHADPFLPDGFLATGDLGRFDEQGRLHVFTRRSDLIVTGGENVYPREVEQTLLALPGVEAASVFGVPDDTWGQLVAAAVVAREPGGVSDVALARHVAAELASFKWPRRIAFVERLPLTPSGKVARYALREVCTPLLRPLDVRALAKKPG